MPTYDYQCKTCGHRFEYFQSISSNALEHCPADLCIQEDEQEKGTGVVVRLISGGAGLVFKGEGFYLTDYVRKGGDKDKSGGSSSSSATASKSESKSDGGSGGAGNSSNSSSTPAS